MGWLLNWHDTDEPGADPGPLDLPWPSATALARIEAAIGRLPLWHVETTNTSAGIVRATRRTRLLRFTDDVTIRLEAIASGTRIHVRSQSRVGVTDLGQNRRNVGELFAILRAAG
jgi:uncharacterized protein (DUF1499 family)